MSLNVFRYFKLLNAKKGQERTEDKAVQRFVFLCRERRANRLNKGQPITHVDMSSYILVG